MKIQFWGVRASIPTPSTPDFVTSRYGGNTSCISVRAPGMLVIFDAGSGLRTLGQQLMKNGPCEATFFFSHLHWDHIQGFPFFLPAFTRGNALTLYGPRGKDPDGVRGTTILKRVLRQQQDDSTFPVPLDGMSARLTFKDLDEGQSVVLEGVESKLVVTSGALNHPGGCFGYRVEEQKPSGVRTFVYATDAESYDPSFQRLAHHADLLYCDAQYTEEEYAGAAEGSEASGPGHAGWGHATWPAALKAACAAQVKHLLLGHHDPLHDDWDVAGIEAQARSEGEKCGLEVTAAAEGMSVEL